MFSRHRRRVGVRYETLGAIAASTWDGSSRPFSVTIGRGSAPDHTAMAPISKLKMWPRASMITSLPGRVCRCTASWFPIVPVGTKSAAGNPSVCCGQLLETEDGRVLAVDVVADFGLRHRAPHGGSGVGHGIRAQVDHDRYHSGPGGCMSEGFKVVAQERGVEELVLEGNGLRVLLLPDPSVPVVAVCVVYHVGSRNEAVGHTGSTHLLEHLMFKGSQRFNPADGRPIARVLERVGAHFNATTWFDRTNYYETLPPEHLELALELEADRMRNALLRESDLATEMTVVRNEFERGENEPFDALLKESFAIAFREHPYHHPTIGWRSDIENTSIDRLRAFYDTFYYPDNASLVLVGSFERAEALELTARHFGPLPRAPRAHPARGHPGAAPGGRAPLRHSAGRGGGLGQSSRGVPPRRRTRIPTPSRSWPMLSPAG